MWFSCIHTVGEPMNLLASCFLPKLVLQLNWMSGSGICHAEISESIKTRSTTRFCQLKSRVSYNSYTDLRDAGNLWTLALTMVILTRRTRKLFFGCDVSSSSNRIETSESSKSELHVFFMACPHPPPIIISPGKTTRLGIGYWENLRETCDSFWLPNEYARFWGPGASCH